MKQIPLNELESITNDDNIVDVSFPLDEIFKPVSKVFFVMKSDAEISITTPLDTESFCTIYESSRKKVKILTGSNSYAEINKKNVDFYHIEPIVE